MASRSKRLCAHGGCGATCAGTYCERHARDHKPGWSNQKVSAHQRGYGATWRRLRPIILARDPVCTICKREVATHVDHIIPKVAGGDDSLTNLRGTCSRCNARKSLQDRKMKPAKP